jgi:hypothetical protein
MLKKIWQSFIRWFHKSFGGGKNRSIVGGAASAKNRVPAAALPPLDDTDREYLFMQLLEGVAHGWQQPRAIGFFNKIRQRVRKSEWLEWLERFGNNLIQAPVPNYELAGRMVQLGQLDCGEIGDLAGEYGVRLLNRQAEEFSGNLLPIMEFSDATTDLDELPFDLSYDGSIDSQDRQFGEVPLELLIDHDPMSSPPARSLAQPSAAEQPSSETREITLEEFSAMLYKDPDLVAELAEQFGIETTDPQVIINTVVAQMQQQVQQISGDLNPIPPEPTAPPQPDLVGQTPNAPLGETHAEGASARFNPQFPTPPAELPPPPPLPKLEYKQEDPWSNNLGNQEQALPTPANLPDRGV